MKRAQEQFKLVRRYLGCVYRDIKRQLKNSPELEVYFSDLLEKGERLLTQKRTDKNKLYSLHAPEIECIAKGEVHKKFEFGVKTEIATTHKSNFVVGIKALPGNPYDGHTLAVSLDQVEKLTGERPKDCYVDLGYRGHFETQNNIHIARTKAAPKTNRLRRNMR
jgi:IS5 family transposase